MNLKIYSWKKSKNNSIKSIDFPPSELYFDLLKKSRLHLENYFLKYVDKYIGDKILRDYMLKNIMHEFADYYYFRISVSHEVNTNNKIKIISPKNLENIYSDKHPKYKFERIFLFFLKIMRFFLVIIKKKFFLIITKTHRVTIPSPDVIYLRKKVYPDMMDFSLINKKFKACGLSFSPSYMISSPKLNKKFGIHFLNSFNEYRKSFNNIVIDTSKILFKDMHFFLISCINHKIFSYFILDLYKALSVINLDSKVFFGIFTDKPVFSLLYRHKKKHQKICTLTDGYTFPPMLGADYCYATHYYSMNNIEASTLNYFGGKFDSIIDVGSVRENSYSNSKISYDLKKIIDNHDYVITITTSQVSNEIYSEYNNRDLKKLINSIIDIARIRSDILFIIKEKKGELKSIIDKTLSKNIFIVRSEKPRLLEENQFEDLLNFTDLTISFAINSMTIVQSLFKNIPFIIFNENFELQIWESSKNFQSNANDLCEKILYWQKLNNEEIISELESIKSILNLQNNSMDKIVSDIKSSFFNDLV